MAADNQKARKKDSQIYLIFILAYEVVICYYAALGYLYFFGILR